MNRAVQCVCGNDIIMTVGGDDENNKPKANRWNVKVEVTLMKEPKSCCEFRLDQSLNNMLWGCQLFSSHYEIEIMVDVDVGVVSNEDDMS